MDSIDSIAISKLFYALIIFIISIFSGIFPLLNRSKHASTAHQHAGNGKSHTHSHEFVIGESLASGVFLGAGLLHMLNDSARDFSELGYQYPIAYLLCGIVFLGLLLLEHVGKEVNETSGENSKVFVLLAAIMLSVHSLFEGVALGIRTDISLVIVVFIAIIAHKWADGYSLAIHISKGKLRKKTSWLLFFLFTLMTPLGIVFGSYANSGFGSGLEHNNIIAPIFSALAAGTFLYIGTLHGLNRAVMVERCCNLYDYMYVILGFGLMAIVGIWV
ncbi:MAG: ZIP family metal transporter [Gammaproteobacteria bacterium]|nr:ZIP family metal transporter [Gammaproteobacteria bacterium]